MHGMLYLFLFPPMNTFVAEQHIYSYTEKVRGNGGTFLGLAYLTAKWMRLETDVYMVRAQYNDILRLHSYMLPMPAWAVHKIKYVCT